MRHQHSAATTVIAALAVLLAGCLAADASNPAITAEELGTEPTYSPVLPGLSAPAAHAAIAAATETSAPHANRRDRRRGDLFSLARGRWLGHCDIYLPGQAESTQTIEMERITEPTDNPEEHTWTLIYRSPEIGEDRREYTVIRTDTPGHYLIDEHNGIILSSYLVDGNVLVSEFQAPSFDIRVFSREVFRRNRYHVEFTSVGMTPEFSSEIPVVIDTFPVLSSQRCTLHRQGPRR